MAKKRTIQKGDTLSQIAEEEGTSVSEIASANPQIKNPDLIFPDTEIEIPESSEGGTKDTSQNQTQDTQDQTQNQTQDTTKQTEEDTGSDIGGFFQTEETERDKQLEALRSDIAEKKTPTEKEEDLQERINKRLAEVEAGKTLIGGEGISQDAVRGRRQSLSRQERAQLEPLQDQLANLQRERKTDLKSTQAEFKAEQSEREEQQQQRDTMISRFNDLLDAQALTTDSETVSQVSEATGLPESAIENSIKASNQTEPNISTEVQNDGTLIGFDKNTGEVQYRIPNVGEAEGGAGVFEEEEAIEGENPAGQNVVEFIQNNANNPSKVRNRLKNMPQISNNFSNEEVDLMVDRARMTPQELVKDVTRRMKINQPNISDDRLKIKMEEIVNKYDKSIDDSTINRIVDIVGDESEQKTREELGLVTQGYLKEARERFPLFFNSLNTGGQNNTQNQNNNRENNNQNNEDNSYLNPKQRK